MQETCSNGSALKLTWEQVVKQFENLVKYAAKQQSSRGYNTDCMVTAEDLYQEGMIKLYDCWVIWCVNKNKDMDEFGPIFRTSLFRAMKRGSRKKLPCIDIEDTANTLIDPNSEDTVERIYRTEGIKCLENMLENDTAKRLLQELAEPSQRTLFEVVADLRRREMLKSQGKKVNIPKDNTIRMKHIIRALQITTKQYDMAMTEIRDKAKLALSEY